MPSHSEAIQATGSARRVARNAAIRSVAEIIGKGATFVMFIAIARKLGPAGFGVITFALALSGQLLPLATFGADAVLTREVARGRAALGSFMGNVVTIKVIATVPALLLTAAVVELGGYTSELRLATYLIALSVALDTLENTWNAAFQAYERLELVSILVVFERVITGAAVFALLAMGAGVIPVASVFPVVAAATIVLAGLMLRLVTQPEWHVQRDRLLPLVRAGIPIGVIALLFTVMLKLDTVLLSLLTNSHDVGIYGSAFRLFESTMFLSWSLGAAVFPWFSRIHPERLDDLRRGYEMSVVVMVGLLMPVGVAFLLLAEPIIHVIYGTAYDAAVLPLRLLSVVVVCYGLNAITSNVLTAHDRPGLLHRVLLITLVQNIVMNLVLIPPYGATGAAMSAAVSGLLLGALTLRQAATALGSIHLTRIFLAPVIGGAAMALVVLLVRADLVQGLLFGIAAYALAFLLAERALFPDDFVRLRRLVRLRKAEA